MKDNTNENAPDWNGDELNDPLASYTPQQRKTIIKGLRIWARVAIRSYMREHGERCRTEPHTDEEED